MAKTLKVIYSTLAIVMIVNSFVVALPILGHAQATEKQAIQQAEFTEAQKAEIEKAQKEARQAIYKELNLSITEQKFVEKYADKMKAFNQELDKYVTYNKKNGNATLNISAFYKHLKTIRTATGLSQKEVLTLKDIALKMVKNYNKTVNATRSEIVKSQVNGNTNFVVEDRGVSVNVSIDNKSEISTRSILSTPTCTKKYSIQYGWFYYRIYTDNCYVMHILSGFSNLQLAFGGLSAANMYFKQWYLTVGAGGISFYYQFWKNTIEQANYACGQTGILIEGNIWSAWYPIPKKKC